MPRIVAQPPPPRPAHFWWLLANGLAICFAVISWTFCLHVFGNPEIPRNYRLLQAMNRAPVLKSYTQLDVPNSRALDPAGLYAHFSGLDEPQRDQLNSRLLRNYLSNFSKPLALIYVEGDYRIEETRLLGPDDFLAGGFAVRLTAMVKPDEFNPAAPYPVRVDCLFPTAELNAIEVFRPGDVLKLRKSPECAAIIHVNRIIEDDEPVVCVTVVPIAAGPFHAAGGASTIAIVPPPVVNPGAVFPLFEPAAPENE